MNPVEMELGALPDRHKHEITEPFVPGHMDGRVGGDLLELEPLGCLHHVRTHGPVQPLCFQRGRVVCEHFQKHDDVRILPVS